MPEERGLYPKMRVRDQLVYLARLHGLVAPRRRRRRTSWLERLGIADRAGDRVETLSLGNQQRVQLGAALVHGPELLVLDEPFSGLDPVGVDVLSGVLRRLADDGVPVVFSSHQLELVERLCEAVAIVKDGRLVAHGRVEELRDRERRGVQGPRRGGRRRRRVDRRAGRAGHGARAGRRRNGRAARVTDGTSPDAVLDAARAAGSVTHFALERPTLVASSSAAVGRTSAAAAAVARRSRSSPAGRSASGCAEVVPRLDRVTIALIVLGGIATVPGLSAAATIVPVAAADDARGSEVVRTAARRRSTPRWRSRGRRPRRGAPRARRRRARRAASARDHRVARGARARPARAAPGRQPPGAGDRALKGRG